VSRLPWTSHFAQTIFISYMMDKGGRTAKLGGGQDKKLVGIGTAS
jgi:hypothetical protein